jgi:hypothetical protein
MDNSHIIKLWQETLGELPRIEYGKDKSFAVLYAEKNGDWLRKNYKLIMTWFNRYQLTKDDTHVYRVCETDDGRCPEDPFRIIFELDGYYANTSINI